MRFAAIARHRGIWPLRWMCETLEVTTAGFYAWLQRPESERARVDRQLTAAIRTSFADSDCTYGARRVRGDLSAWGYRCGVRRVQRLMSCARLVARPKRRRLPFDLGPRPEHSIAPNVLQRQFARPRRTANGSRTSPTCGRARDGCTWQWCWICSPGALWAGRCIRR